MKRQATAHIFAAAADAVLLNSFIQIVRPSGIQGAVSAFEHVNIIHDYLYRKSMPRVPGPQWVEMVGDAFVTITLVKPKSLSKRIFTESA